MFLSIWEDELGGYAWFGMKLVLKWLFGLLFVFEIELGLGLLELELNDC